MGTISFFLYSAYPLQLGNLGRHPLGLGLREDSCELSYVGFRFGKDIEKQNFVEIAFQKIQSVQKWGRYV